MSEPPPPGPRCAILLCLGLNLALLAGIALAHPAYLSDYRRAGNPDAIHYVLIGRNFWTEGAYSRSQGPPFVPDMLRTPVYPLFAGGLDLLGRAGAIYVVQALLHVGCCVLLFRLVRAYFGSRAAWWASVLLATDLAFAVTNFEPMSETLFVFLTLASLVCLLPVSASTWRRNLAGGALLGLAILTRPAALYLPVILAGAYLIQRRGRGLRDILGWGLPVILLVGAWVGRNAAVLGVARLTIVDTNNLVYFVGAGAYQVRHGYSLEEAQEQISREFRILTYREAQNDHLGGRSAAAIQAELRPVVPQVLFRYPRELCLSSLLAIGKANVSHATAELGHLLDRRWEAPGMSGLVRLRGDALDRLGRNSPMLVVAFFWQMLHIGLALGLALVGIVRALRDRAGREGAWVFLAVLGYFTLTVALFGYEAFYRCRLPAQPFLLAFAGLGLVGLFFPSPSFAIETRDAESE